MRARFVSLSLSLAVVAVSFARDEAGTNGALSIDALRAHLASHLSQERFARAQWGVKIVSQKSGATVFESAAHKLLKPASNAKLYTGALALDLFGPEFQIRTSIYSETVPRNGVLPGSLVVYGRGDPTLSDSFDSKDTNGLGRLVRAILEAGIKTIDGDVIADATYFSGPPAGTGWTWDDLQYYYGAEVSALSVGDNVIDLTIRSGNTVGEPCTVTSRIPLPFVELVNRTRTSPRGTAPVIFITRPVGENRAYVRGSLPRGYSETWRDTVSISNVPLWFATLLKHELTRAGVAVKGRPRAIAWPETLESKNREEIATITSPPMARIVERMMKVSQNLYAQLLLLQAGATATAARENATTEELGIQVLGDFLQRAGIPRDDVLLDDGSGLSRSALVTPNATVALLRSMAVHQAADPFRASLPVPGVEGTLRNRLKDLRGRVRAKTGSIRHVETLSGYLTTRAGEELVFSIMLNAFSPAPGKTDREEVDAVVRLIAALDERID